MVFCYGCPSKLTQKGRTVNECVSSKKDSSLVYMNLLLVCICFHCPKGMISPKFRQVNFLSLLKKKKKKEKKQNSISATEDIKVGSDFFQLNNKFLISDSFLFFTFV